MSFTNSFISSRAFHRLRYSASRPTTDFICTNKIIAALEAFLPILSQMPSGIPNRATTSVESHKLPGEVIVIEGRALSLLKLRRRLDSRLGQLFQATLALACIAFAAFLFYKYFEAIEQLPSQRKTRRSVMTLHAMTKTVEFDAVFVDPLRDDMMRNLDQRFTLEQLLKKIREHEKYTPAEKSPLPRPPEDPLGHNAVIARFRDLRDMLVRNGCNIRDLTPAVTKASQWLRFSYIPARLQDVAQRHPDLYPAPFPNYFVKTIDSAEALIAEHLGIPKSELPEIIYISGILAEIRREKQPMSLNEISKSSDSYSAPLPSKK